jgi:omega-amidase
MKIACYQMPIVKGDKEANKVRALIGIENAADQGTDLLLLPEFWSCGFDLKNIHNHADRSDQGVFLWMRETARHYGIALAGTHPRKVGDEIFNTAVLFLKDGTLAGAYDKAHLFSVMKEDQYLSAGSHVDVFDTPWGPAGFITCYDLRFPEWMRKLADRGARLVLVPAFWPDPRLDHWQVLLQARAIENQIFIAGCNRSADPEGLVFGYSAIYGPEGRSRIQAGREEALICTDLDLNDVMIQRKNFPAWNDRRIFSD